MQRESQLLLSVGAVVALVSLACADKGQPVKEKASGSATQASTPAPKAPRQVTHKNYCGGGPAKDGAKADANTNALVLSLVLDGVNSKENDQIYVSGKCDYVSGVEQVYEYQRLHTWDCEFRSYLTGFPPVLIKEDVRGNPLLESWQGKKPQPIIYSPDTSENPVRIDELGIRGPGTFAISCPRDKRPEFEKFKGCRISWYNKFIPDESHYAGVCGETVAVRGVYEDPPAP